MYAIRSYYGYGFQRDGFDIHAVGHFGVGHDGRGVGVEEDDRVPLLLEGLAGLGARIVEFAGLADDDRPRTSYNFV